MRINIPSDLSDDVREAYRQGYRAALFELRSKAGKTKSPQKAAACRENGLLGGAPIKKGGSPEEIRRREQLRQAKRDQRARERFEVSD